jgi:hypothetical protein
MQNAGKTLILTMLTISATLANAQLKGAQFSGLPIDARRSISSALLREVPGLSWAQLAKLTSSDGQADDRFGFSVAVSGDTVVVGLSSADGSGHNAAYVFVKPSTGWANMTETAELTRPLLTEKVGTGSAMRLRLVAKQSWLQPLPETLASALKEPPMCLSSRLKAGKT